ncbi:hypothetical protein QFZ36_004193 [Pseudarthrobacter siccitolerans]|uniref:GIY-YIG domain-containing protein n=1 Tax=Pseudarthrobacter siccitolerans TaxID=861266 RepID=A0ABU0PS65_9MICC|nr:hypothetical protein [Pseudarthrobacter siccitolerans]MDQ0676567.1 hypothetical protein [Pseudarthrobacter siccitolerans]
MAKLKHFTVHELMGEGFRGFQTFQDVRQQYAQDDGGIPKSPGVYVVLRVNTSAPQFLTKGFGGTHKARKANAPISELEASWVHGASVLYFGKAGQRKDGGGLWDRINEYSVAGQGRVHGHSGGEYIWQLADARKLLVAWKVVQGGTEKKLEDAMILAFKDRYGKVPFANRTL